MKRYNITYWYGKHIDSALLSAETPEEAAQKLVDHYKRVDHADIIRIEEVK